MTFEVSYEFDISPETLYNAWLDSEEHTGMTGGEATISHDLNVPFSAWDGYITGENRVLIPFTSIKQTWRTEDFLEEQEDSIVEIKFVPLDKNKTKLVLIHSNLSESDKQYAAGWFEHYFEPMTAYFSS